MLRTAPESVSGARTIRTTFATLERGPPLARATHGTSRRTVELITLLCFAAALDGCGAAGESETTVSVEQQQRLRAESQAYADRGIEQLVRDDAALALGQQLFAAHCASCHGENGEGRPGVTRLAAGPHNYPITVESIRSTIANGRRGTMPAMGQLLGEVELGQVVAYIRSLPSADPLSEDEKRGRQLFTEHCARCHGDDARGKAELGAPSLADDYWQHGDSMMKIRLAVTRGVETQCPAHAGTLTAAEIDLLTAFVLGLVPGPDTGS